MDFDPTYNYGETDLTKDDNLVYWKFGELIKNLVTLASDAKRQYEIIGIGATCNEMAEDFYNYFTISYHAYVDGKLLTELQVAKLQELDTFFDDRSGDKATNFWDDNLLETNFDWKVVRQKASNILFSLGMQDLTLEFDRDEKYEITDKGKKLTAQMTKTRLVRQNAS